MRRSAGRSLLTAVWPWLLLVILAGMLAIGRLGPPSVGSRLSDSPLEGAPIRVIDGDTFDLAGERIRLHGVDAPETETAAGQLARQALVQLIAGRSLQCSDTGERSYGRIVAICKDQAGVDVAAAMVSAGWALDAPRFSNGRYQLRQWRAQIDGRGMHGS